MFICPNCHVSLIRAEAHPGVFWVCPSCGGRSATIAFLHRRVAREAVNALWLRASEPALPRKRACPACRALMTEVPLRAGPVSEPVDVCPRCQFVWFDAREYEALPTVAQPKTFLESLPPEARERYALLEVEAIRKRAEEQRESGGLFELDEAWQCVPALFGLPVEYQAGSSGRTPLLTWSLAAVLLVAGIVGLAEGPSAFQRFGLIPAEFWRFGGLTFVTAFFLHGGLFHLLSNLYFLVVFGDNVEETVGMRKCALLIALAAVAGNIAQVFTSLSSVTPCIGASGGISGLIAYYALAFPHARLGMLLRWGVLFKWVNLSARTLFVVWLVMQTFGVWLQQGGLSQVSAVAHLGGAAVGLLFWCAKRRNGQSFL